MKIKALMIVACSVALASCSGIRRTGATFTSHAESVRVFGYQLPANDHQRALELVPQGAKIETIHSTPADWSSVLGVLSNIIWIGQTEISGTLPQK